MPDYSKGRIYAIRAPGTDEVYIGSTIRSLAERMTGHRSNLKMWRLGRYHYVSSYKLLEREGVYIELIEMFPCETKEQLNKREGEIIRATANCVNLHEPGLTHNQSVMKHRAKNKDAFNAYMREYTRKRNNKLRADQCYSNDQGQPPATSPLSSSPQSSGQELEQQSCSTATE